MDVGSSIKRLREYRDLTQTELAERVGINRSVLNRIELGTRAVRDDELRKFADFFNVSTDYLLGHPTKIFETLDMSSAMGKAVAKEHEKAGYYHDPKVAAMVDELKNRPGMRILFDASRDLSEDDINFVVQFVERLKKK